MKIDLFMESNMQYFKVFRYWKIINILLLSIEGQLGGEKR